MTTPQRATVHEYAAWILAALATIVVLQVKLLPALIAGLLVHQLVHTLAPFFAGRLPGMRARELAVGLVVLIVVGAITAICLGVTAFMQSEGGSFAALLAKMAEIIDSTRSTLPGWAADFVPQDNDAIRERASGWLREHSVNCNLSARKPGIPSRTS